MSLKREHYIPFNGSFTWSSYQHYDSYKLCTAIHVLPTQKSGRQMNIFGP